MKVHALAAVAGCLCCALVTALGEEVNVSTATVFSRSVPWNTLPAGVQQTFQQQSGSATMAGVEQTYQDGQIVYRAQLQSNGVPTDVVVTPEGTLYQDRTQLTWNDLPPAVQQAYLRLYNLTALFSIRQHAIAGAPVYDFGVNSFGQLAHLQIDENGSIINYFETPPSGMAVASVTWDQLPVAVQNSVSSRVDSGQVTQIKRGLLNGQVVYDVSLGNDYTQTEWRIAPDGTLLSGGTVVTEAAGAEPSQNIEYNQLPPAAQSVVASIAGSEPIRGIRPVALNGRLCYEVAFTRAGEVLRIYVSQEGEVLQ